jgi:hypothetical protein
MLITSEFFQFPRWRENRVRLCRYDRVTQGSQTRRPVFHAFRLAILGMPGSFSQYPLSSQWETHQPLHFSG